MQRPQQCQAPLNLRDFLGVVEFLQRMRLEHETQHAMQSTNKTSHQRRQALYLEKCNQVDWGSQSKRLLVIDPQVSDGL